MPTFFAQEYTIDPYASTRSKGDQSIMIELGGNLPLFVLDSTGSRISPMNLSFGGSFAVEYRYMMGPNFALGGSGEGAFSTTIGGGTLFLAPIGITGAWVWGREPMEYEVDGALGMNIMRLYGNGLIEPYLKIGGGVSRFIDAAWSIGAKAYWWFVPEFHIGAYSNLNAYANFYNFRSAQTIIFRL